MLGIVHWKYKHIRKDKRTKFAGEIRNNKKIMKRTLGKHNANCDSYGQLVLKNIFDVPKSKMFQYYSEMLIVIEPNEMLKCYYGYDTTKQKLKHITEKLCALDKVFPVYYTLQKEYYMLIKRNIVHKQEINEQVEYEKQQRLSSRYYKISGDSLWKGMYLNTKGNDSNYVVNTSNYKVTNNIKNNGIKRDSIIDMRNIINEIERNEHTKQTHADMFNRRESKLKQYKNAYIRKVSKMFTVNKRNDELLKQYFLRNKQSGEKPHQHEHKQNNNKLKELCILNSAPCKDNNPKLITTTSQTISHFNKPKYKSVKTFLDIKKERNAYTLKKSNKQLITQYIFYKNNKCINNSIKPTKRCYSSNEANALSNTKIPKLLPKHRQRHIQSSRDSLIPRYTLFTTTTPHKSKQTKQSSSHSKYNTLSTVSKGSCTIHLSPIQQQQHKVFPFKTVNKFNNIF
jgi:hypothetical protein